MAAPEEPDAAALLKADHRKVEGLFAQARKAGLDMDELGERMAAEKAQLVAAYKVGGVPRPETPTLTATTLA